MLRAGSAWALRKSGKPHLERAALLKIAQGTGKPALHSMLNLSADLAGCLAHGFRGRIGHTEAAGHHGSQRVATGLSRQPGSFHMIRKVNTGLQGHTDSVP